MRHKWFWPLAAFLVTITAACSAAVPTPTSSNPPEGQVLLYYYNPDLDKDASGNIQCSAAGLVGLPRIWYTSMSGEELIRATIQRLLTGEVGPDERAQGITTEFPLEGVELLNVSLQDGVLTLTFADPSNRTSGGACRAAILWAQIEATALQFPGVEEVRFEPESVFQP